MASEPAAASGIPPDPVRWTRSPPLEWWVGVAAAVALAGTFAMMAAAVGLGALADGLLFRPSAPLPLPAAALWAILVLVPSVVLLPAWLDSPRRVGVGPDGVRVEFALRTLLGSWPTVRAMPRPLRGGRIRFGVAPLPTGWRVNFSAPVDFWATPAQARAILGSPACPIDRFPPTYLEFAGLSRHGRSARAES